MKKNKNIAEILHRVGLKHTPGRAALLCVLMNTAFPLTQEELASQLTGVELNRVTIYRALNDFLKTGLVHRIENGNRVWKFAYGDYSCHQGHPHFICKNCGKVECLEDFCLPELHILGSGYSVEEQELYLRGLCDRCSLLKEG